jgi:hypoxanthine phosphoribosyltransferase
MATLPDSIYNSRDYHQLTIMDSNHLLAVRNNADLLFSQADVEQALDRLAEEIEATIGDKDPLLLCVMTGGLVTSSELFTRLNFPLQLDYLHATRYQGTRGGERLKWITPPSQPLAGRTVLVVDDILDEGLTLAAILQYCRDQGARAIYSAVLVEKLHDRKPDDLRPDFIGLPVADRYVFGYGMDYHGYWRNLKGIYAVNDRE